MRNIVILGSTGSIGRSTLELISRYPERFRVKGLAAGKNIPLLMEQILLFRPETVGVSDEKAYKELKETLDQYPESKAPEIVFGAEGISSIAAMTGVDIVVSAIVGAAGLLPTLAAVRAGRTVALANKETLVMAGDIVMAEARKHGSNLLPVDSEHSAIFQCMRGHESLSIRKLLLTASGGPFVGRKKGELGGVTPEDALKHPNWSMGRKISIDSATLMNKGLEVIEACHLFGMPAAKVDVLIHPQSIIHSMVEFLDGGYLAQLSRPDMKGPIAYALFWPERPAEVMEALDWESLSGLTFQRPDHDVFPCLSLAYEALEAGGTMPAVLNAANEMAVEAFLCGKVGFTGISDIIKKTMASHTVLPAVAIDAVIEADRWARLEASKELQGQ